MPTNCCQQILDIIEKLAKYVAKNGPAFEKRIKDEHRDNPKFSFLLQNDPFNAYYLHKVEEIRHKLREELNSKPSQQEATQQLQQHHQQRTGDNEDDDSQGPTDQPMVARPDAEQQDSNGNSHEHQDNYQQSNMQEESGQVDGDEATNSGGAAPRVRLKLNEYIQQMTMKLEEPPTLNHLATSAPSLTHMDCDIIKLTAQFIATYGRSFLLELVSREQNNAQFDFLKPQHGQFSYMTNLIMQYALIQNQPLDITEQMGKDATSQKHVLDKIRMRAEWNRMLELEQKKREEAEEKEKLLYSQIDWHDFVIKETIDYQPHERGEYPPTTADQVGTRLLLQQRYEEQNVPEEMEIDMDMDSGDDERSEDGTDLAVARDKDEFAVPADRLTPKPDQVIIRKDYDPKSSNKVVQQDDNYFVSPITNERIPVDKIHEHVRYNLADPRYLEKKDHMLRERLKEETVFASGSQIQSSLKNLAERRTDIFGMNDRETAIGRRIGEEEQAQSKDDRLIWDGHKSSLKKKKLN